MIDTILVIEPEAAAADRIEHELGAAGFAVHRAVSGIEGLAYLRTSDVACVVLDRDQPMANGLETLRDIRRLRIASPVIMTSRSGATDLVVEAIKADAFDFAVKCDDYTPILVEKVRKAVRAGRERVTAHRVVRASFVGREPEIRALDQELARAIAGEGRVVLVTGDEGIGKTSLALEFVSRARASGCTTLRGHCPEAAGAPAYWPWIQILRAYAKSSDPEVLAADLGESAAAVAWIAPTLRASFPLGQPEPGALTRFQLADGIVQFLRRVAARHPLVLVFDDLHRADGDAAHLFRFFAAECADVPVLMVGALREDVPTSPVVEEVSRVANLPVATVLRLGRFDVEAVRRYVEESTSIRPSPRVVEAIFAKTEGHPLFVAEITRLLATDGRLSEPGTNGEPRLAMPATRRHAIAARVSRRSAGCRALLDVAAVIGHEFASGLLASVAKLDACVVCDGLAEAVDDQLVVSSEDEPGLYKFAHVLVRDVLYDALPEGERRTLHRRVADALELRAAENWTAYRGEPPLAAIAHHCRAGANDREDQQRALHAVVAAGDRAVAFMAYDEAARHYEAALRLAEQHCLVVPTAHQLLVRLADALRCAGNDKAARAAGRRALALADASGDAEQIAAAALAFAGRLPRFGALGSTPQVAEELTRALGLLPASATALRAQMMARLAEELAHGDGPSAPGLARQAIEMARATGDASVLAAVLRTLHSALWAPDDIEWRPALAAEIVALAAETGDRMLGMNGQLLRLWSALEHGNVDEAWQQLGVCQRLAGELRLPHFDWVTAAAHVCLSITRSRFDEAEALVEQAMAGVARHQAPSIQLVLGGQREHVRSLRGKTGDLAEWLHVVQTKFPTLTAHVECAMICHDAWLGHHERARARLAALVADDLARVRRNATWSMNMAFLAEAAVLLGEREAARCLHAALLPFAAYNAMLAPCYVFAPVAHHLAGLEMLLGDRAGARRHHEEALALAERTGAQHWVARVRFDYGTFLLDSPVPSEVERGRQLVASGRALAESVDARWLLREPLSHEAEVAPVATRPPDVAPTRMRRVEDEWEIEFRGARATVPRRAGMAYLRCLLERPGVPVPAIELASLGREAQLVDHAGGPAIDRKAVAAVRHRLAEIELEIAACAARNVSVGPGLLHEQRECARYLSRRSREMVGAADRARSGVTKAISRAIDAIARVHPALGHHLARHVETGRLCMYVADPGSPMVFEL